MPRPFSRPNETSSQQGPKPPFAQAQKPKPLLEGQKVGSLSGRSPDGLVTYSVLAPPPKPNGQDRRNPPRRRTRLRSGKVLDRSGKFLIECQVRDRSPEGAQLRLMKAVVLPRHIQFFDDEQGALLDAEVIWRKNGEIGIQFRTKLNAQAFKSGSRSALGGKYYAVT
jgi:hypothetical protein